MKTDLLYRPSFAAARVQIGPGEAVRADGGAMLSMSSDVQIETAATGGLMRSLKRSMLGGESFFMNTFRSPNGPAELIFAPSLPGDLVTTDIQGTPLLVNSGSFLVAEESVDIDTKWKGGKGFFTTSSFFMVELSGRGQAVLSAYGALHSVELGAGERYTVDTGHVIAFPASIGYAIRRIGGLKSTLFSGEGFVVDFTGPGTILLQTRSQGDFLAWLIPNLPSNNGG
ncbi:MAG: TIGR00266 family protein [Thermomicrobiales bacterium]